MADDDPEFIYLTFEDVLELFAAIAGGATEQAGAVLRSRASVEGAIARPATHAHYRQADLALQEAALLAHGIAESQAFVDGNKRLALVAMLTFLEVNGSRVDATDQELADWIIGLSAGLTPEELAGAIRPRLTPVLSG